jgi:hypothetical protein
VIDSLLPALHAGSRADLYRWTEADLIQWMDESLKRLARKAAVFVYRSTGITSTTAEPLYALPEPDSIRSSPLMIGTGMSWHRGQFIISEPKFVWLMMTTGW